MPKKSTTSVNKIIVPEEVKKEEPIIIKEVDKKSKTDNRFERIKAFGDQKNKDEIIEKVKIGLLKWSFYGTDGDTGYHYYLKIKK